MNPENTDNTNTSNDNSQEEEKKKVVEDNHVNQSYWSQLKPLEAPSVNSKSSDISSNHNKILGQVRPGFLSRAGKGKLIISRNPKMRRIPQNS